MELGDPDEGYDLVYPFVVCHSHGGPYDDQAFAAGMQIGRLDHALAAAAAVGVRVMDFTILADLVPQAELAAMNRGFTHLRSSATEVDEWVVFEASTTPFADPEGAGR